MRYKARWVVRGFEQLEGVDYAETFASVVKPQSYKALFAIAAAFGLLIEQMDVKTAFLYGLIDEEVYVEQPRGLTTVSGKVCRLKRSLYGLKQAPRIWYETLAAFLETLGFHRITADEGVFARERYIVAMYVDDLLIFGPDQAGINDLKRSLNKRFKMSDLGPCKYYLGLEINRTTPRGPLRINQKAYITKILKRFGMEECNGAKLPMDPNAKLAAAPVGYEAPEPTLRYYRSLVGSLMYAAQGIRADIAHPVGVLGRFMANPTEEHLAAGKRVLRYLAGTIDHEMVFQGPIGRLRGFTDADYAGDVTTRRSTGGYVFLLGQTAISWSSKRQNSVTLSSCEAEYVAQAAAAQEAVWLRRLLSELNCPQQGPTQLFADNQGAIALAKNPENHARTKHIDVKYHFIRQEVSRGSVVLQYIGTGDMLADALTKAVPGPKTEDFRRGIGLLGPVAKPAKLTDATAASANPLTPPPDDLD